MQLLTLGRADGGTLHVMVLGGVSWGTSAARAFLVIPLPSQDLCKTGVMSHPSRSAWALEHPQPYRSRLLSTGNVKPLTI